MMWFTVEGLATEKLVEEVQQEGTQSDVEVAVIQVEWGDLCCKIATPTE